MYDLNCPPRFAFLSHLIVGLSLLATRYSETNYMANKLTFY